MDPQQGLATQLANIEKKTGKSFDELRTAVLACGQTKHGEIRSWVMEHFGLGHGDANTLTHLSLRAENTGAPTDADEVVETIYTGKKAHQRAIHEALMRDIEGFGDFEVAPKKGYVSLRRKKQFAMLGPKTNDRFEVGINLREEVDHSRVKALPAGGMCHYVAALTSPAEIDSALIEVLRRAYDAAG